MREVVEALRRTVKDAEEKGDKSMIFPISDAKMLLEFIDKMHTTEALNKAFQDGRQHEIEHYLITGKGNLG